MTIRYVGAGGSDSNNGTSWATRKLTLNGAEDTPVVAGDTVYVGPGTYRELLTVDVSGTSGNPISYIGDYDGSHTDGVGGVVRITGSDNDQTATRANVIGASAKNYRTFTGFLFDTTTSTTANIAGDNWVIQNCAFYPPTTNNVMLSFSGATHTNNTVQNCIFYGANAGTAALGISHSSTIDNMNVTVQNCIFISGGFQILNDRVGGVTVKNSVFFGAILNGVRVRTALTVGQTMTVNNCILFGCITALQATTTAEFSEDYNTLFSNTTNRSSVSTGANSKTYPALFDTRWFFQLISAGAGPNNALQLITPFDLSSASQLLNLAGTSPTTTDMRGTAAISSVREWGALEYDSTLKIKSGSGISRSRAQ